MNFSFEKRQDRKTPVLLSLGIHVVLIALIASITFTYPIASFFDREVAAPTERIQYVRVQPAAGPAGEPGGPAPRKARETKIETPAPLLPPAVTPSALPPIPAPSPAAGSGTGTGTGTGGGGGGLATGVEPALPDPRIELRPNSLRMPLSVAQRNDSAVKAIYMAYREAEIEAASRQGRSPRDWTFEKNGQKYGLDSSYIYLGKFKLPSAILAALPFNFGGVDGRRIIEGRNSAWIQNDIYTHSQGLSEDDFRSAVRRIRERKEKEKKEAEEAKRPGIVP